jgi:hypothetical protein
MNTRRIKRSIARLACLLTVTALLPAVASAQSAQQFSLQFSGLVAYPFGGGLENVDAGFGWEGQLRINPSAFSIGAGAEQTFHDHASGIGVELLGGFVEPRYVIDIGSDNAVLYVSARLALSQITLDQNGVRDSGTGYTLNGGGGFLFPLSQRVNLDAGATVGYKDLGTVDRTSGPDLNMGTGGNFVGRVGLAIGIG